MAIDYDTQFRLSSEKPLVGSAGGFNVNRWQRKRATVKTSPVRGIVRLQSNGCPTSRDAEKA
jgi:hypothetical protein